jgi:O-acetylserine/cysteine efflux transporter
MLNSAPAIEKRRHWSWTGTLFALLASALWGLTPVATKVALDGFSPELLGVLRLALAAILFRLMAGGRGRWFVADPWTWVAGIALALDFVLYNYGIQRTAANVAGLVVNIELISTIAFAVWLLGERLTVHRVLGSVVTLGGVLVVTMEGMRMSDLIDARRMLGNILVMAAAVAWSLYAVAQRRIVYGGNLFERLTPIFSVAALTTLFTVLRREAWVVSRDIKPVLMFLVLALLGTNLVYWIYARAQELVDMTILSILLSTIPVFAVLFAYLILSEPVTGRLIIGGVIIVAGISVTAMEPARRASPPSRT